MVLDVLQAFKVWNAVPVHGSASYSDMAAKTGLHESLLRRILRFAMDVHIFDEIKLPSGEIQVVHTATSRVPVDSPRAQDYIGHNTDDCGRAAAMMVETIKKYGDGEGAPGRSAMANAWFPDQSPDKTFFEFVEEDGEGDEKGWRERRFMGAMSFLSNDEAFDMSHVHTAFDWDSLGAATVVDVGGSSGQIAFDLAKKHPELKCVVQDLASLESGFLKARPAALEDRVSFQALDFFKGHPVADADVYIFKLIFHDWSDTNSTKIIRNLVPSLKKGSRIIVLDGILPPRGELAFIPERQLTAQDLQMEVAGHARERSVEDWTRLFVQADARFSVKMAVVPSDSFTALIEVVFNDVLTPPLGRECE